MSAKVEQTISTSEYLPVKVWGTDHWSTFAYLETVCVDHAGLIQPERMRCHPRLHLRYAHVGREMGATSPTRLHDGSELEKHDDWSCVEDMSAVGLVEIVEELTEPTRWLTHARPMTARVKLTPLGLEVAAELRKFKANGGNFRNFRWVPEATGAA